LAGEDVFERDHAGVGEHQRRVVLGDDGRAGADLVPLAAEELEEGGTNFGGRLRCGHGGDGGSSTPRSAEGATVTDPAIPPAPRRSPRRRGRRTPGPRRGGRSGWRGASSPGSRRRGRRGGFAGTRGP